MPLPELLRKFTCVLAVTVGLNASAQIEPRPIQIFPGQQSWIDVPEQAAATEGLLDVGGARIWYWDTGGQGEPVVLVHPFSGSALIWGYQQPVLAQAGYRVIAYSRRGHYGSDVGAEENPGTGAGDLLQLVDHLELDKFHLVGFAAGADVLPDFAVSHSDRLLSLTIGCTIGVPGDPAYRASDDTLLPAEFRALPAWLKELSPAYRAANPEGTEAWRRLEAISKTRRVPVPAMNDVTPARIAEIDVPVLLLTGDSDLYMPPHRLREYAKYWTNPEVAIFREAGHSVYWEQPEGFNRLLLDFLGRSSTPAQQRPPGPAADDMPAVDVRVVPAQYSWRPEPEQAPADEGYVDVGGVRLWYWDTGGEGEAVMLMHPYTGSAAIWGYQQPVLVEAGYRVIAYSRRGHYRSDAGPPENPGNSVDDLHALVEHLGLSRFHLVGSAAGGFIVPDYAASYPDNLISMIIATSTGGAVDPEYTATFFRIRTPEIVELPHWLKELGPSYRAAYPAGVERWRELEQLSVHRLMRPPAKNRLTWEAYESLRVPALLIGADADLYMPPPMLRELGGHLRESEIVIIQDSGHSAYWEQYEAFNSVMLEFLRRHREN